mgnify:CR=1 FL=1
MMHLISHTRVSGLLQPGSEDKPSSSKNTTKNLQSPSERGTTTKRSIEYTHRDLPLIAQALTQRWAIPDRVRQKLPELLQKWLDDPGISPDTKVKIANTFLRMDTLNLRQQLALTPTMTIKLEELTDQELDEQIKQLENNLLDKA